MPESLPQLILPIKLERSPERLTSLGGLVVLEELARAAGVWEKVDRRVEGPKSGRGYQPHEFVQPLVWMLHAGGRRLEDLRELRGEQEVLARQGLESVPDAGTVGRLAGPARASGGRGDAASQSGTGGGRPSGGVGGTDSGRRCPGDRGREAGSRLDLQQGEGLHADAGLCEWGVRGTRGPGRQCESGGRD